ncbi:hypothetical protein Q4603_07055 [Zobellia galactanivorans]|uniref:hypothetical protein n=1 Tax=Zobellia TaxID=112040 RepID=UPI000B532D1F|nr:MULTISPECIES: hypothetical protein [Zobellia]MDO6808359.1 hypothetical protein [Zobellia galactanivorans]OWW26508.1 hypothetical protein B4Q04_02140 [Zobellia sp. OII3]
MKKLRQIENFFVVGDDSFQESNLSVGQEITFPNRSKKQKVCFQINKKSICIDLIHYDRNEIKQFVLIESELFNKKELKNFCKEFSLETSQHPLSKTTLIAKIPNISDSFGYSCYGAIKKTSQNYYLIIFAKKGSTDFEENIIHVHGIWEIVDPTISTRF